MVSAQQLEEAIIKNLGQQLLNRMMGQEISPLASQNPPLEPISIVVCTRDRTELLKQCLKALLNLDYPKYEIIIVDNAPSNDATAKLAQTLPVRYVCEPRPGLDWARNRGIQEAHYDIVAFTDDDAKVDGYWLRAIAQGFQQPEVMCVTGLVAPAELETDAQYLFEFDYGGMGHGFNRRIINKERITETNLLWASSFGVGVNMAFRREIFDKIGPFDPALDVGTPSRGCGDVEMFHRLVAKGYTIAYEPSMLVWHTHRRSRSALWRQLSDNGCSFGVYLLTCLNNKTVNSSSILRFFVYDWLGGWIISRLVRGYRKLPRYLIIPEILGMLQSPQAYRASQITAKNRAASYAN